MPTTRERITAAATAAGWTVGPLDRIGFDDLAVKFTRGEHEVRAWFERRGIVREYAHRVAGTLTNAQIGGRDKAGRLLAILTAPAVGAGLDDEHPEDCAACAAGEAQRHTYEPAAALLADAEAAGLGITGAQFAAAVANVERPDPNTGHAIVETLGGWCACGKLTDDGIHTDRPALARLAARALPAEQRRDALTVDVDAAAADEPDASSMDEPTAEDLGLVIELPETVWLCGDCFEQVAHDLAQCADGCSRDLDHVGACHPHEYAGTACQRCGETDRLTGYDTDNIDGDERAELAARLDETAEHLTLEPAEHLADCRGCAIGDQAVHRYTSLIDRPLTLPELARRHARQMAELMAEQEHTRTELLARQEYERAALADAAADLRPSCHFCPTDVPATHWCQYQSATGATGPKTYRCDAHAAPIVPDMVSGSLTEADLRRP